MQEEDYYSTTGQYLNNPRQMPNPAYFVELHQPQQPQQPQQHKSMGSPIFDQRNSIQMPISNMNKTGQQCPYKSGCPCGSKCKCGPGCRCGSQSRSQITSCSGMSINDMDRLCKLSEGEFKKFDSNATILPGIGLPSQNNGVCTIMHGMGAGAKNLKINGLESKSPLANAALFSTECSGGKFINLYEMMLPEGQSSVAGEESNAERYTKELNARGMNVAGSHWHWWASSPYVAAIHHQNIGMNPVEFSRHTVAALSNYRNRM